MATRPDYYIITREAGERPQPWCWELRRYSSPMGVRVRDCGYQSQMAAEYAGKQALVAFLDALEKEESRR
jgi:hypothetical protein